MKKKRDILITLRGTTPRKEIAEALNITPQMLGMIERGDRTPSLELARKIADLYGASIDEIFFNNQGNDLCPTDNQHKVISKKTG